MEGGKDGAERGGIEIDFGREREKGGEVANDLTSNPLMI